MATPAVIGYGTPAATSDRIVGPLIATFAVIAIWQTTRELRWVNSVLGAWLLISPWILGYGDSNAIVNSMATGTVVLAMSLQRGKIDKQFGGGWAALWKRHTPEVETNTEGSNLMATEPYESEHPKIIEEKIHASLETDPFDVVVITGASAGVGRAAARAFARQGAHIGLLARGVERLEATRREVEELGGHALVIPTDVADANQVEAAAAAVEETFGPIDIWVNNAMVSVFSPIKEMTPEDFKRVTDVTYLGYVHGTLAALKRMLPRDRGVIVQVGSALAYRGIPLQAAYCGAKHAVEGFTDSLRVELLHDKSGIKVTMIQMPALNTPQFGWVKSRLPNKAQPIPPIFEPELAADAIVWAAHNPRREVIVGGPALQAILMEKFFPALADRILARNGYKSQQTDQPRNPNRPNNLWDTVPGDQGAHGSFDDRARRRSMQFWIARHRNALTAALGSLAAAVTTIFIAVRGSK